MHYIIDGYNLLFRVLQADEDLQAQREKIVQDLFYKTQLVSLPSTLVFDAQHQKGMGTRSYHTPLEVCFTPLGKTADEYILELLKEHKGQSLVTVVTSDKKLAWLARRMHAKTESVEEFLAWLNKRVRNKMRRKVKSAPPLSPLVIKKKRIPELTSAPEDCFEYYLELFEARSEELPSKEKKVKKSHDRLTLKKMEPSASEMERWLSLFERDEAADE